MAFAGYNRKEVSSPELWSDGDWVSEAEGNQECPR